MRSEEEEIENFNKGTNGIKAFLESGKMRYISKFFQIENVSSTSKLFFYIGLIGIVPIVLCFFFDFFWLICWLYAFTLIILSGFIFTKPEKTYNFGAVIGILFLIALIPSKYGTTLARLGLEGGAVQDFILECQKKEKVFTSYLKPGKTIEQFREYLASASFQSAYDSNRQSAKVSAVSGFFKAGISGEIQYPIHTYIDYTQQYRSFLGQWVEYGATSGGIVGGTGDWTWDPSGYLESVNDLAKSPFGNIEQYMTNAMDVVNWIVFFCCCAMAGATIGDAIKLDIGSVVEKAALIAIAVLVMTMVYTIFGMAEIPVRTVWDTVGNAWNAMLSKIGLAQLDIKGNYTSNLGSITNGLMGWVPVILVLFCFGMAFSFRHTDLKTVLFAKDVGKKNTIAVVTRPTISIGIAAFIIIMLMYVSGYFLITAEPEGVVFNPYITLMFYIGALVALILVGTKTLIVNRDYGIKAFLWNLLKWTVFGLFGLFVWFMVFQPVMYAMNVTDYETGLITMSQGTILEADAFQQLFLVATPETSIFQIAIIGIGNRVYYYFKRVKFQEAEIKKVAEERRSLLIQYMTIPLDNSTSKENLKNIAKASVIWKRLNEINVEYFSNNVEDVPFRFFILPTMASAFIGSFFFSWYHCFRRFGGSFEAFLMWWQTPTLGMVYFGAGFFLCLIAFFSFPAAILVHALNNIIAIILSGGG